MDSSSAAAFPDIHQVASLRQRLWARQPNGRAAVMIGAGFSRNATPKTAGAQSFPLWWHLVAAMVEELRPTASAKDRQEETKRTVAGSGSLTLALEYEETFGRSALDQLIIRLVPDNQHEPGELHRLLLRLPWADVFTVNYDTLLERARPLVRQQRRYELVTSPADLSAASAPRIVKLHGSLPSGRPFIFTEEDFRRYPREFAPFVNTVQQAMMENDVVLLGFSGDDPNFLSWLGWIRDELTRARPRVYLCGALDLTDAKRKILERRGITPIDLGPLFPEVIYGKDARHRLATYWLLYSLEDGAPLALPLKWPYFPQISDEARNPELTVAPLPPPATGYVEEKDYYQGVDLQDAVAMAQAAHAQVADWETNQAAYPGWALLPLENRRSLALRTEPYTRQILKVGAAGTVAERLHLFGALAWRLRHSFLPVFPKECAAFSQLLDELSIPTQPTDRAKWAEVAFLLLREARYDGDSARFAEILQQVAPLRLTSPVYEAWARHETAQERLEHLDPGGALEHLKGWPDTPGEPIWDLRRAGLLAEAGQLRAADFYAQRASTTAVESQPTHQPTTPQQLAMLSVEACAAWVRYALNRALYWQTFDEAALLPTVNRSNPQSNASTKEEQLRNAVAEAFRCDPSVEVTRMREQLAWGAPEYLGGTSEKVDFYYGRRQITTDWRSSALNLEKFQPAFDIPALFEAAGHPMFLGDGGYDKDIEPVVKWLADISPSQVLALLIRTRNYDSLRDFLDRARVVALLPTMLPDVIKGCLQYLENALEAVIKHAASERLRGHEKAIHCALLLVGRSMPVLAPSELRTRVVEVALKVWEEFPNSMKLKSFLHKAYGEFSQHVTASLTAEEVVLYFPRLLLAPYPLPFHVGPVVRIPRWLLPPNRLPGLDDAIAALLVRLRSDSEGRVAAIYSLRYLHVTGWLTEAEQHNLAEGLWQATPAGIPEMGDQQPPVWLLFLPEPSPGLAVERLREHILGLVALPEESDEGAKKRSTLRRKDWESLLLWSAYSARPKLAAERLAEPPSVRWIDWAKEEAVCIFAGVEARVELAVPILEKKVAVSSSVNRNSAFPTGMDDLNYVGLFLRRVLLPRLTSADAALLLRVRHLVEKLTKYGFSARTSIPALASLLPECRAHLLALLRLGLANPVDPAAVEDAAQAIFWWVVGEKQGGYSSPPAGLLLNLTQLLTAPGFANPEAVSRWFAQLVADAPKSIWPELAIPLLQALRSLLNTTADPTWAGRLAATTLVAREELAQRPTRRAHAAAIASLLRKKSPPPELAADYKEVLERWEDIATESPYSEVRRAWATPRESLKYAVWCRHSPGHALWGSVRP